MGRMPFLAQTSKNTLGFTFSVFAVMTPGGEHTHTHSILTAIFPGEPGLAMTPEGEA